MLVERTIALRGYGFVRADSLAQRGLAPRARIPIRMGIVERREQCFPLRLRRFGSEDGVHERDASGFTGRVRGNDVVMNREQRRGTKQTKAKEAGDVAAEQQQRKLTEHGTPQDVTSERAKSQLHGKVTADKWNQ